jgi:hypothetical protein
MNKEDEVLGAGNCHSQTEQLFWRNEFWHCQRQSQQVSLGHLDKEQEFRIRAMGCERYNDQREICCPLVGHQ